MAVPTNTPFITQATDVLVDIFLKKLPGVYKWMEENPDRQYGHIFFRDGLFERITAHVTDNHGKVVTVHYPLHVLMYGLQVDKQSFTAPRNETIFGDEPSPIRYLQLTLANPTDDSPPYYLVDWSHLDKEGVPVLDLRVYSKVPPLPAVARWHGFDKIPGVHDGVERPPNPHAAAASSRKGGAAPRTEAPTDEDFLNAWEAFLIKKVDETIETLRGPDKSIRYIRFPRDIALDEFEVRVPVRGKFCFQNADITQYGHRVPGGKFTDRIPHWTEYGRVQPFVAAQHYAASKGLNLVDFSDPHRIAFLIGYELPRPRPLRGGGEAPPAWHGLDRMPVEKVVQAPYNPTMEHFPNLSK